MVKNRKRKQVSKAEQVRRTMQSERSRGVDRASLMARFKAFAGTRVTDHDQGTAIEFEEDGDRLRIKKVAVDKKDEEKKED
jgi:hypothetical protein